MLFEQLEASILDAVIDDYCAKYQIDRSDPRQFQKKFQLDPAEDITCLVTLFPAPPLTRVQLELTIEPVAAD